MAGIVQLKRSSVSGRVPDAANIEIGEPVVNFADQIIFTKNTTGSVIVVGAGTTSNVVEGTNLYFTNARVYANVVAAGFYDTVSNTAPIGASESGTTLSLSHLNSGVAAATYGNATLIPQYVVNATGHITSASNVTVNVANTNIVGNIIGSQIAATGVTAATYGNATFIPSITVDQQGRITSASNVAISASSGGAFTFSGTAPSSPSPGDRWLDSDNAILYTYVDDGTSSQWVDLSSYGRALPTILPITTRASALVNVSLANGYVNILNRTGSTVSVLVF